MRSLPVVLTCLFTALAAPAQAPDAPSGDRTAPHFDLDQARGVLRDADGTPWAIGRDYKAAFQLGGMEFVPALGRSAPHNLALAYRLQTIGRGAHAVHTAAANGPRPTIDERGISFARDGIVERFDARADGVALSYVFAERPAGTGDLIVTAVVHTALHCSTTADGTLLFADGAVGGVRIGTVTGIDGAGRCCAGSLRFAAGRLELRLPADFVDTATYPLVLDPLFGTAFPIGAQTLDDLDIDAAYEESFGIYLAVWTRSYSAVDQDVLAQRVGLSGTLVGGLSSLTTGTANETAPAVAAINARNRFVVCWQEGPSVFGPWNVHCRSVDALTGGLGATIAVGQSSGDDILPAISGDRSQTGTEVLIAWEASASGILARTVNVSATGVATAGITRVVSTTTGLFSRPELPKSRVPGGIAVVSWTHPAPFATVRARAVDYTGLPLGVEVTVSALSAGIEHGMDGDGTQFLIATGASSPARIECRSMTWDGTALTLGPPVTLALVTPMAIEVGFLGERHLVAWQQPTSNPFDSEVHGLAVKPDCTTCGQEFTVATVVRPNQRTPAIATHFAASSSLQEALLCWGETDAGVPFNSSVVGQRFLPMLGTAPVELSASCSGGGSAATNGPFAPGNGGFEFVLDAGDPVAPIALLLLGVGATPVVCGCTFTSALVTEAMLATAGGAAYAFPVPCDTQFLGLQIEFQWLLWGAAASPCPFVPNLVASNRLLVTLSQ